MAKGTTDVYNNVSTKTTGAFNTVTKGTADAWNNVSNKTNEVVNTVKKPFTSSNTAGSGAGNKPSAAPVD